MKKYMVVWGATFFVVVCVSLYLMMESVSTNMGKSQELDARLVEDKIARIQSDIVKNQQTIKEIKSYVRSMSHGDSAVLEKLQRVLDQQEASQGAELQGVVKGNQVKPQVYQSGGEVKLSGDTCSLAEGPNPESDIQNAHSVRGLLSHAYSRPGPLRPRMLAANDSINTGGGGADGGFYAKYFSC
uniref:Uncharacterized protein n=1 Tax=Magallana gigas TaxID=29159 RepID=K1QJ37_MAGGI